MRRELSRRGTAALLVAAMAGCGGGTGDAAPGRAGDDRLAALALDPASVTVSGVSAGGYMAVQFHVAHSALVQGAGILAAGPYYCAQGTMRLALGRCMKGDEDIPTDRLLAETSELALAGSVDPIASLADDRVWIYRGEADPFVAKPVVDALETYYQTLIEPQNVVRVELPGAGHIFPTADPQAPNNCFGTDSPFVGRCDFDAARVLLGHLYGELAASANPSQAGVVEFDQRPYAKASGSEGLGERGWLFVPAGCESGGGQHCRLHVVFHGCKQGTSFVDDAFVKRAGYLEVAAANHIVLLFPQIAESFQPLNPNGCWDWWGYEGEDYATQRGSQIAAVRAMVADLLGENPR